MPEPTVEQLMSMDKVPVRRPSAVGPLLAFFLLPPLGVYLLWKEKAFHATFALLSAVLGIANSFSGIAIYSSIYPKLQNLYSSENIQSNVAHPTYIFLFILISLIQVGLSLFLWKKAKQQGYLETWALTLLAVLVILFDFILLPILIGAIVFNLIWPFYQKSLNPYNNFPITN